jgi:hypothetical protein
MLASDTRVRGFEPGQSRRMLSFVEEVKQSVPCRRTRQMTSTFTGHFSPIVPPFPARGLSRRCGRGGFWWRKFELIKPGFVQ